MNDQPEQESPPKPDKERFFEPQDLESCPRCGLKITEILWGKTNCPNCGLHFECC